MYAGLAPYEALALYAVITYMDTVDGVFVPEGGMHAMPTALRQRRPRRRGAEFRYGDGGRADRAATGHDGGACAASGSPAASCRAPTPSCATPTCPSPTARCCPGSTRRGSPAAAATRRRALVWHAGVRGAPARGAAHHNIHFGTQWDGAFDALLERRRAGCPTRRSS